MWQTHYIHRGFIYPFTIKSRKRIMPFAVISMGLVFNLINAYLNGRHVFTFSTAYDNQWMAEPQFAVGVFLFVTGFIINRKADSMLVNLRSNKGQEYSIPRGGLFEYVSCPNYLGEIIIWVGWAIATWSLPGLAFALWTVANLAPRSKSHHQWYRATFSTYPNRRKALIPYIW